MEEQERYEKLDRRYHQVVKGSDKDREFLAEFKVKGGTNFDHIQGNTLGVCEVMRRRFSRAHEGKTTEWLNSLEHYLNAYDIYKQLLREFPDFAATEFSKTYGGYFPEIESHGKPGTINYILESERKLRKS